MLYGIVRTKSDATLTFLRLILGIVFFAHGAQKMLGWFHGPGFAESMQLFRMLGIPDPLAALAISAEFFGGLGLIFGFLGRLASLGIMSNMIVAIAMYHWQNGLFMNWNGGQAGEGFEFHLLAIALGMAILVKGSGALSADLSLARNLGYREASREQMRIAA